MLYATSNKGKLMEVEGVFKRYGVEVVSPKELGIEMEVPENGVTLEANAAMKARVYAERLVRQGGGPGLTPPNPLFQKEGEYCTY